MNSKTKTRGDDIDRETRGGAARFANLDPSLPLSLFPVRLTTRYHRPLGAGTSPTELRIRILPDPIVTDAHSDLLSARETELGQAYWAHLWNLGKDEVAKDAAHQWLVDRLDLGRALWVRNQTEPTNIAQIGVDLPKFPKRELRDLSVPIVAELLPDRWVAAVYQSNEFKGYHWSNPVKRTAPIVVAPQLVDMPEPSEIRDFLDHQALGWRHRFSDALDAGLALTIPIDPATDEQGFSDIVVFGVTEGDLADDVDRLLRHHRYGAGLDLVPQGTPTNNLDDSPLSPGFDVAQAFEAEAQPAPVAGVDLTSRPALLYQAPAADAVTAAFGLPLGDALARSDHSELQDSAHSAAMNRVLWPVTAARLLSEILAGQDPFVGNVGVLEARDLLWLRDWFSDYVRGSALLPTLRIGDQPYGLLPVTKMPVYGATKAGGRVNEVASVVAQMGIAWAASRSNVATMSPLDEGQLPGATEPDEAIEVAAILGAVPHPTALRLRAATDDRASITATWAAAVNLMHSMFGNVPRTDAEVAADGRLYYTSQELVDGTAVVYTEYLVEYDEIYDGAVLGQYYALGRLRDWLDNNSVFYGDDVDNPMLELAEHIDTIRPLLLAHDVRSKARRIPLAPRHDLDLTSSASLPTETDPDLFYTVFDDQELEPARLQIVDDRDPDALLEVLETGLDLIARRRAGEDLSADWGQVRSLFGSMVEQAVHNAGDNTLPSVRQGLNRLKRALNRAEFDSAPDAVERLLRETIGLVTHRHDAWHTSVAAFRLASLRAKKPTGLQVGGYGWLTDVQPDAGLPDTQGFIHGPSLDHATTAAILRSAWTGLTSALSHEPFAVDLSSDRVRRGRWLLDGVRNGQDLGELLGQRVERRLHDRSLDTHIEDIRRVVLDDAGQTERPTSAIVDGLPIADAYSGSGTGLGLFDALELLRLSVSASDQEPLLAVFEDAVADLDSTKDLLMADSVHNLVRGNFDGTAASLAVAGSNPSGIPDPRVADVGRSTTVVTHRVCALLPNSDSNATEAAVIANPDVAAWLEAMLPAVTSLVVEGRLINEKGAIVDEYELSLTEIGVTAMSLVALCTSRTEVATSPLARLVEAWFASYWSADVSALELDFSGVVDAFVVAGALRDACGTARGMTGADMTRTDEVGSVDVAELRDRQAALIAELDVLAAGTGAVVDIRTRAASYASIDVGLTIAALRAPVDRVGAALGALAARIKVVRTQLQAPILATDPDEASTLIDRLGDAVVTNCPIAARFTPPPQPAIEFKTGRTRLGDAGRVRRWLLAVSRVQPGAGKLHEALMLAETVAGEDRFAPGLAQLADVSGVADGWAALDPPDEAGGRSRLCVVSVTDPAEALAASSFGGLLFESWSEPVPGPNVTTGVAIHFDSPTSRAPQAVLLMSPPPEAKWDIDVVRTTLKQTLEVAQQRAVGPETLDSHGMFLPGVFLDEETAIAERTEQ